MNNRPALLLSVLLALPLLLGSCTKKLLPDASQPSATNPVPEAVKAVNLDFQFMTAKGKAQFGDQTANVNLRMRKDSAIWLSASLLGIEGGRLYITRDSVQVIDKLRREYYSGDFAYLSQRLNVPVTFDMLQALLLGNYLAPISPNTQPAITTEGTVQRVRYEQAGLLIMQLVDLAQGRPRQLLVQDSVQANQVTVDYADFRQLESNPQPFAFETQVQVQQRQQPPTLVTLTYRAVDLDKGRLQFPFSVPKGYARKK
ncbi:DUF4292 domain-containing protein [Hymenobacter lapidiphilus]|uniref:DUF4292 domain-containing protein n=1 Tax=Hymenobacter lapidiphilus TaxID=2608003 RepID=A0A7Y7PLW4_9BACT|nr:DUF4292 domain-containing protein [Hymenobacter lapidiphilus]NVO30206.1 DUF4292 domain-containing protein [Hymenobacter lapidiphilus]